MTQYLGQPKISVLYSEDGGDSHEPPIGISGDPIYVDPPGDLTPDDKDGGGGETYIQSDAPDGEETVNYYKYKFVRGETEKPYFNLEKVSILSENPNTGYINFIEFTVPRDVIASLRLWIENRNGDPSIIIEGKNGGSISTVQRFEAPVSSKPPKTKRPKRYYLPNQGTRIVKWEIVDEAGAPLEDASIENGILAAGGDDQYYFYVSFNHE